MEKEAPSSMDKVLIVDDERAVRFALSEILKKNGFAPSEAEDGSRAIEIVTEKAPDLVLLDVAMPGMNGIETLGELRKINSDIPIIIVTGHGDIATAVQAIKLGAYDFLTKPPQVDRLIVTIQRALERSEMQRSIRQLDLSMDSSLEWVFGKSQAIKGVIRQIRQVAWSDFSVIIQGETGTGKSVAAQTIHSLSRRAAQPFQVVDIGVIPETLIESELFGHEKGAFTGADRKKQGLFEAANGGTIFMDELENMPLTLQGKLLRVVEEKKVYALGSTKPVAVDVRIMGATNRDLKTLVKERKFREDLYYRLSEFTIDLPPLRERAEDIPFLSAKLLLNAAIELNKPSGEIDRETIDLLTRYPWPGNIRELKNVIRRAALLSENGIINKNNLEFLIEDKWDDKDGLPFLPLKELSAIAAKDAEKKAIKRALALTKGNKSKAASMLEVDYKTLLTKIKDYLTEA
jgi:DNA-binding NtrC family response regulator